MTAFTGLPVDRSRQAGAVASAVRTSAGKKASRAISASVISVGSQNGDQKTECSPTKPPDDRKLLQNLSSRAVGGRPSGSYIGVLICAESTGSHRQLCRGRCPGRQRHSCRGRAAFSRREKSTEKTGHRCDESHRRCPSSEWRSERSSQ